MRTVAVVGIDGSGKTDFVKELAEKLGAYTLHIPGYSGIGSRTTRFLGRLYAKFADIGHRLGSHRLVSLAYRLTALLYNEFMKYHRSRDGTVLIERHPTIDAIVYADEYDGVDGLEETVRYVYSHIPEWPSGVIWVRPPSIDEAIKRINRRLALEGGTRELHETKESLLAASRNYQEVLPYLEQKYGIPYVEVYSDRPPAEMVESVMQQPKFSEILKTALSPVQQYSSPTISTAAPQ